MQLGAAQARLGQNVETEADVINSAFPESDRTVRAHLSVAERLAGQAQRDLVQIIRELNPTARPSLDWRSGLNDYLSEWSRQNGIQAEVQCDETVLPPSEVQLAFLRIVQEACSNIARHSQAQRVKITLETGKNNGLLLTIEDDGKGFDSHNATPGMGLQNMRQRAEALLGGWFKIDSHPENGTQIQAGCNLSLSLPRGPAKGTVKGVRK